MVRSSTGLLITLGLLAGACMAPPDAQEQREAAVVEMDEEGLEVVPVEELAPDHEPYIEPEAVEIVGRMSALLQGAKRFSFHAETTTEHFLANDQTIELSATADARVRRPDGLFVERRDDRNHRRFYYDGKSVSLFDVDKDLYATNDEDIPGTIMETLDRIEERLGITLPLSDLVVGDPGKSLTDYADSGVYVGVNRVRGVPCHHLAFANDVLEWQLWVQAEGQPLPHKLAIVYLDEPGRPRFRAHMSSWNLNDSADATFTFTPPAGATRIEIQPVRTDGEEE